MEVYIPNESGSISEIMIGDREKRIINKNNLKNLVLKNI
jgi:hypothetical protein